MAKFWKGLAGSVADNELSQKKRVKLVQSLGSVFSVPGLEQPVLKLLDPHPHWYTNLPPLPPCSPRHLDPASISSTFERAASLFKRELEAFDAASVSSSDSDSKFLSRVLTSGTLSDRLSALTLVAQASPLHNTKALENLSALAKKKSRDQSLKALRAIVDWWIGGGAPDRKLRFVSLNQRHIIESRHGLAVIFVINRWATLMLQRRISWYGTLKIGSNGFSFQFCKRLRFVGFVSR